MVPTVEVWASTVVPPATCLAISLTVIPIPIWGPTGPAPKLRIVGSVTVRIFPAPPEPLSIFAVNEVFVCPVNVAILAEGTPVTVRISPGPPLGAQLTPGQFAPLPSSTNPVMTFEGSGEAGTNNPTLNVKGEPAEPCGGVVL